MDQITINDKAYNVGFSFRAIKLFEERTGKSVTEAIGTWDNLVFFWCTLKAKNKDFDTNFDEFVDIVDAEPDLMVQFQAVNNTDPEPVKQVKKKHTTKELFGLLTLSLLLLALPVWMPIISTIFLVLTISRLLGRLTAIAGNALGCRLQRWAAK